MARRKERSVCKVTLTILMLSFMASFATTAKAQNSDGSYEFELKTHAYEETFEDVTAFHPKSTNSDILAVISGISGPMDIRAVASNNEGLTTRYSDVSEGHVYRVTKIGEYPLENYAYEWKYPNVGIKGEAVVDSYTLIKGSFLTDNKSN